MLCRLFAYVCILVFLQIGLVCEPIHATDNQCYKSRYFTKNEKVHEIFIAALKKRNVCIEFHKVHHAKSHHLMKTSIFDVDFARIHEFNDTMQAPLKRIELPWITNKGYLICQKGIECTKENIPNMTVGTLRDVFWSKKYLGNVDKIYAVSNRTTLRSLFAKKRVDALILSGSYASGLPMPIKTPHQQVFLEDIKTYVWVQNKNKKLIAILQESLPEIILAINAITSEDHGPVRKMAANQQKKKVPQSDMPAPQTDPDIKKQHGPKEEEPEADSDTKSDTDSDTDSGA